MNGNQTDITVEGIWATCPSLRQEVDALATLWLAPAIARAQEATDHPKQSTLRAKSLNDPIWHTFDLEDREILLLDSPLLQRMRGVRQLGLAHLVFPAANHDRFEHLCGVVEAADRMLAALKNNAERRRQRDQEQGISPPTIGETDRQTVRLAALLHDVGHGPFSHAIEPVVNSQYVGEVKAFNVYAKAYLHLDSTVAVAELVSILVVLSPAMAKLLSFSHFQTATAGCSVQEFQLRLTTLIMGARRHGRLAFLSAVISGQVDADKLDYLARDAHHSGMPITFDTDRLLKKLEIIRCTADTLPERQQANRDFAEASPNGVYHDLGIAAAGVGALEQMLVGRTFLYDRLYHHHKVRAADAMAQRLLIHAEKSLGRPFELRELYPVMGDDAMIRVLGGELYTSTLAIKSPEAAYLAKSILERDLFVRAFAIRASFHRGLPDDTDEAKRTNALAELWSPVSTDLADLKSRLAVEKAIFDVAKRLYPAINDTAMKTLGDELRPEHIIVDLADNRVKPVAINIHTEDGFLEEPNLYFNPARWSQVYNLQKRTGYVFCPRKFVPLIALAAKIYFFERWGFAVGKEADRFSKTLWAISDTWLTDLRAGDQIDDLTVEVLRRKATVRTYLRKGDVKFPENWANETPSVEQDFVDALRRILPQGISAEDKQAVKDTAETLALFVQTMHKDATWATKSDVAEKDLQSELHRFFEARQVPTEEGGKLSGGAYDVLVRDRVLIENKVAGQVADPFDFKPEAPYQANRYAIAKCQRIFFTLVGYIPMGSSPIEQTASVRVRKLDDINRTACEIRFVVPYGAPVPSRVKAPNKTTPKS